MAGPMESTFSGARQLCQPLHRQAGRLGRLQRSKACPAVNVPRGRREPCHGPVPRNFAPACQTPSEREISALTGCEWPRTVVRLSIFASRPGGPHPTVSHDRRQGSPDPGTAREDQPRESDLWRDHDDDFLTWILPSYP